ncbi:peroxidasin homolog isoform X2 [Orbicella faveolata]|uniref:peroxidasin homolog isoform X2 n=1 Tax=Orbicella faveolata TaxID=48498 RepID=UPI0009E441FD|nr:peroxidasin homolog isoform X2 [Orbicella faveolata]
MMASISWLGCSTKYFLLLLAVTGLSILPSAWCQYCNSNNPGEPRIEITPPSSKLHVTVNETVNLTCTAWQADSHKSEKTKPKQIEWFDPQDKRFGNKCYADSPRATHMSCTVTVSALTNETFGNYTCRARNGIDVCSTKKILVQAVVKSFSMRSPNPTKKDKSPEIVNVPVNQTAVLGSNVTFNCTATGYPKPTITWVKENDSSSVQYNSTPEILTGDGNSIFSQLVITEVKSNDYGIYHCVAKNSAGVKTSSATLGYRGIFCCVFDF